MTDEILFGYEVVERLPDIVRGWVGLYSEVCSRVRTTPNQTTWSEESHRQLDVGISCSGKIVRASEPWLQVFERVANPSTATRK